MLAEELPAEVLAALREVMQVGPRVARTGRAGAERIERGVGEFVHASAQLQKSARRESGPALRDLRGDDAIKHVHAAVHGFEDVERRADAHEVARAIKREKLCGEFAGVLAFAAALADGEAADGESIEWHLREPRRALSPQVRKQRALHDRKYRLRRIAARRETACGPALCDLQRGACGVFIRSRGDALVERHHDVAADRALGLDAHFGTEHDALSVEVALEARAFLSHRALLRHGENLKPAGIREHGIFPAHESVDAAGAPEDFRPRSQQEVIRIRE